MKFNSKLIHSEEQETLDFDSSYKGLYSTMQFVLRLNNEVRNSLNNENEHTPERLQAFSTYLHENIHWWQHIGSNFGFILNTSYPSFASNSFANLKKLIEKDIKYKPLLKFDNNYLNEKGFVDIDELNIIVNNFHDLEYAKLFCLDNRNVQKIAEDKRFFLSVGHCYFIFWTLPLSILGEMFDKNFDYLPNINNWIPKFEDLKNNKIEGFHTESSYTVAPLGIKAIYEGQAIFNQILYLKYVFKENNILYKDFIENGMLHGIYLEAFDTYLKVLKEDPPVFLDHSLIGLFLLICDLSINPTNGFPADVYDYKNFINKNDPGLRFVAICMIANSYKEILISRCEDLSKETYILLSKFLNKKIGCKCSYKTIGQTLKWKENKSIVELLEEESEHSYNIENLPFRLFLAKHLKFQEDKYENPHIFCWIGYHIPNANTLKVMELFEKHLALFTDSEDGEIKPILFNNISEEKIYKTFNDFYYHTALYELILKWITEDGEFKLDYKWLFNQRNEENILKIKEAFKFNFNIDLEDIKII